MTTKILNLAVLLSVGAIGFLVLAANTKLPVAVRLKFGMTV